MPARNPTSQSLQPSGTSAAAGPNKHQLKTQAMKLRLLKAARKVFTRDGFEAARIDDIAAAAGHTRGAFYAHFKTKEDLFLALIEQEISLHSGLIRKKLQLCANEPERLDVMRQYYASRVTDREFSILLLEFKLYALRHPRLRKRLAEAHRQIRHIVKLDLEELLPSAFRGKPDVHEMKRVALEALLNGLILESAYDPERISETQVKALLGEAFDLFQKLNI